MADLSRRGFLKIVGGVTIGLMVKPTAILSPEILANWTEPEGEPDGGWYEIDADVIDMATIGRIMKSIYLPAIEMQIMQEGPLLKFLKEKNAQIRGYKGVPRRNRNLGPSSQRQATTTNWSNDPLGRQRR